MRTTLALSLLALANSAHADTQYWFGAADNNWSNPANWNGGHVPSATDTAVITPLGTSPLITANTTVNSLWLEQNASLTCIAPLAVSSGATIDGNLYLAGKPVLFTHADNVTVSGTITMWDGAKLYRTADGTGDFTITPTGTLLVPYYDKGTCSVGTALKVQGLFDVQTNVEFDIGHQTAGFSSNVSVVITPTGEWRIEGAGPIQGAFLLYEEPVPICIVDGGSLRAVGPITNYVELQDFLEVVNNGIITADGAGLSIAYLDDMLNHDAALDKGAWLITNGGSLDFGGYPIGRIGPNASVHISGEGSDFYTGNAFSDGLFEVDGRLILSDNATFSLMPDFPFENKGFISIEAGSSFAMAQTFINDPAATLAVSLRGQGDGDCGILIADAAKLHGTLQLGVSDNFTPTPDARIQFLKGTVTEQDLTVSTFNSTTVYSVQSDYTGAYVVPGCPADFDRDGFVDFFDFSAFVACFEGGECPPNQTADFNNDQFVDFFDFNDFVAAFEQGC